MKIQLTDEMRVENDDSLNFTLFRKTSVRLRGSEKTKEQWKAVGYYATLEAAAIGAFQKSMNADRNFANVAELINAIREGAKLIAASCKQVER